MTTRTKPQPKALTVAEATERAQEARVHLDDLTSAVTSGDTSVTRDALSKAQGAYDFAELQLEGAKVRERREAEEQLRKDVEAFRASMPKRLAEPFAEVAAYRKKALEAYGDLLDAIDAVERTRSTLAHEWREMRPTDIALDWDDDLPDWYRAANPSRSTTVPKLDWFKAALALARDAVESRHKGQWRMEQAELLRIINSFVAAQERQREHAQERHNIDKDTTNA